jgi:hypothetical protein
VTPALPEVASYDLAAGSLGHHLELIQRAQDANIPEATILLSARALEGLSNRAVRLLRLEASPNIFSNLSVLERLSLIDRPALVFTDALRRLGNEARHATRPVDAAESNFATLCLAQWLYWFFCKYAVGPKFSLPRAEFERAVHRGGSREQEMTALLERYHSGFSGVPGELASLDLDRIASNTTLAALVIDVLIRSKEMARAQALLDAALTAAPSDLGLNQMRGLILRRSNKPLEAIKVYEAIYRSHPRDEESIGLLAGSLKGAWEDGLTSERELERARRLCHDGWISSQHANPYLGINAAALSLWLGDESRSAEIATRLLVSFRERSEQLGLLGPNCAMVRDYYDVVTEAEALLLTRQFGSARTLYRQAFEGFPQRRGDIEGSIKQANRSLDRLGEPPL